MLPSGSLHNQPSLCLIAGALWLQTTSTPTQESCLCGPEDACSARSCSETLQVARWALREALLDRFVFLLIVLHEAAHKQLVLCLSHCIHGAAAPLGPPVAPVARVLKPCWPCGFHSLHVEALLVLQLPQPACLSPAGPVASIACMLKPCWSCPCGMHISCCAPYVEVVLCGMDGWTDLQLMQGVVSLSPYREGHCWLSPPSTGPTAHALRVLRTSLVSFVQFCLSGQQTLPSTDSRLVLQACASHSACSQRCSPTANTTAIPRSGPRLDDSEPGQRRPCWEHPGHQLHLCCKPVRLCQRRDPRPVQVGVSSAAAAAAWGCSAVHAPCVQRTPECDHSDCNSSQSHTVRLPCQ